MGKYEWHPDENRLTDLDETGSWDSLTAVVGSGSPAYFKFVPSDGGTYIIESFSESDTYVTLRDEFGAEVDSNDDGSENNNFYLSSYLEPDTVYYRCQNGDTSKRSDT